MARFGEKHRTYDKWTAEELEMLGRNEVPPNRTVNQCRCKALALGWKFRAPGSNRWTEPEVQMLREGKIPCRGGYGLTLTTKPPMKIRQGQYVAV